MLSRVNNGAPLFTLDVILIQIINLLLQSIIFVNYLRVTINCDNNIPMCYYNIPLEIPHSNRKL